MSRASNKRTHRAAADEDETPLYWLAIKGAGASSCGIPMGESMARKMEIHFGPPPSPAIWQSRPGVLGQGSNYEVLLGFRAAKDRDALQATGLHSPIEEVHAAMRQTMIDPNVVVIPGVREPWGLR